MNKPTHNDLARAHAAARLRGTLADAMCCPAVARCLEITAVALAVPRAHAVRPPPGAPPKAYEHPAEPKQTHPRRDFKRACAADNDE